MDELLAWFDQRRMHLMLHIEHALDVSCLHLPGLHGAHMEHTAKHTHGLAGSQGQWPALDSEDRLGQTAVTNVRTQESVGTRACEYLCVCETERRKKGSLIFLRRFQHALQVFLVDLLLSGQVVIRLHVTGGERWAEDNLWSSRMNVSRSEAGTRRTSDARAHKYLVGRVVQCIFIVHVEIELVGELSTELVLEALLKGNRLQAQADAQADRQNNKEKERQT